MLGLLGFGTRPADAGVGVRGVRVERRLLDQVGFLVGDVLLIDRAVGVGLRDLSGLALRLDLGRAERLDVADGVGDALDLERVEDEALLGELLRDVRRDLVGELLALAHQLDDREGGDDAAQRTLELLGGELLDRLVLRGETLRGPAHVDGVGADLDDRDAVDVERHAVERLRFGVQGDLARTQRDDLVALRDRVDERLAVDDHRHRRFLGLVAAARDAVGAGEGDGALHLLLAPRDDERFIGSGDLDPAAREQQRHKGDDDRGDDADAYEEKGADGVGELHDFLRVHSDDSESYVELCQITGKRRLGAPAAMDAQARRSFSVRSRSVRSSSSSRLDMHSAIERACTVANERNALAPASVARTTAPRPSSGSGHFAISPRVTIRSTRRETLGWLMSMFAVTSRRRAVMSGAAGDREQHVVLGLRDGGILEVGGHLAEQLMLCTEQALPRLDGELAVGHSHSVLANSKGPVGEAPDRPLSLAPRVSCNHMRWMPQQTFTVR